MGAAASTTSYTYKTAEEALAAGKTQIEIDAYIAGYVAGRAGKMEDDINNGCTPLYIACQNGHLDVVRELLGADGIQANQANQKSQTPINVAADNGHVDVVRLLLSVPGIDVTTKDAWGTTPLAIARESGHGAVVSLLESFSSSSSSSSSSSF